MEDTLLSTHLNELRTVGWRFLQKSVTTERGIRFARIRYLTVDRYVNTTKITITTAMNLVVYIILYRIYLQSFMSCVITKQHKR